MTLTPDTMKLIPIPPDDPVYLSTFWQTKTMSVIMCRLKSRGYQVYGVGQRWDGIHIMLLGNPIVDMPSVRRKFVECGIGIVRRQGNEFIVRLAEAD